jgi:hypothetical protein
MGKSACRNSDARQNIGGIVVSSHRPVLTGRFPKSGTTPTTVSQVLGPISRRIEVGNRLTTLRLTRLKPNSPQSTPKLSILSSVRDDLGGEAGNLCLQAPGAPLRWM